MQETQVQFLGWKDTPEMPWRRNRLLTPVFLGFPGCSDGKESTCNVGDLGLIPGLERSFRGGHGIPLQYSCLESPHGQRNLAGYSPRGCRELDMTERRSTARPHVRQWVQCWPSLGTQHMAASLFSLFFLCSLSLYVPFCLSHIHAHTLWNSSVNCCLLPCFFCFSFAHSVRLSSHCLLIVPLST